MRKSGAKTEKLCWNLKVINNDIIVFEKDYPTLKNVGIDIGFKYNRVVELATGRKKQQEGFYDSRYIFKKINKVNCQEEHKTPAVEVLTEE